jgi:hypothetical protein
MINNKTLAKYPVLIRDHVNKFRHLDDTEIDTSEGAWHLYAHIKTWCKKSLGYVPLIYDPDYYGHEPSDDMIMGFRSEEDAATFKLKYL